MKQLNNLFPKKYVATFCLLTIIVITGSSQNVAINQDGSAPDSSAILDIQSTTRGLLMPRMTSVERESIDAPATGLMVYDTDTDAFWCFAGSSWIKLMSGYIAVLEDADGDTRVQVEESTDEDVIRFDVAGTEQWVMNGPRLENRNSGGSIFIGRDAGLGDDTTSNLNVAVGQGALKNNVYHSNLVAMGDSALYHNAMGAFQSYHARRNTALGSKSQYSNTTGYQNTSIGFESLYANTYGRGNTAVGFWALFDNNGTQNTAVGSQALYSNTTAHDNSAFGHSALKDNISGTANTAVGKWALYSNKASSNTAVGREASQLNTTGYENTSVGDQALYNTTTAGRCVAVGYHAGYNNETGFYTTAVGWGAGPTTSNIKNSTALGRGAATSATNQIRIGNSIVTSIGGYEPWTNLSDGRFKKNIQDDIIGLEFIMALEPVSYQIDLAELDRFIGVSSLPEDASEEERQFDIESRAVKGAMRKTGFIAQDVEQAAQALGYDFSGVDAPKNENDFYGLRYAEFVVPLVKAVQELSERNDQLAERVSAQQAVIIALQQEEAALSITKMELRGLQSEVRELKTLVSQMAANEPAVRNSNSGRNR